MELTYTKCGDYYIPDLTLDGDEEDRPLGKYGRLRETFLREHHHGTYTSMLLTGRLNAHLDEIDQSADEMVERVIAQMAKADGVTEALKASDQMAWVQKMNSIPSATAPRRSSCMTSSTHSPQASRQLHCSADTASPKTPSGWLHFA